MIRSNDTSSDSGMFFFNDFKFSTRNINNFGDLNVKKRQSQLVQIFKICIYTINIWGSFYYPYFFESMPVRQNSKKVYCYFIKKLNWRNWSSVNSLYRVSVRSLWPNFDY